MKKVFLIILTCIIYQFAVAQKRDRIDAERLLQYYQAQQYAGAVQYLKSIYKDSTDLKKLKQLAYANLMAGNLKDAEQDYLRLNTQLQDNPEVMSALGAINVRLKRPAKAKEYYQDLLKIDSNNFRAYKQLAIIEQNGDSVKRQAYLVKANHLNTLDGEVASQLAQIYFKDNLFIEAEDVLKPAVETDSTNVKLLTAKMPVDMALKKYEEAIKTGKKLLEAAENPSEELLFQMAICYREIGDYKAASDYLQKAIKEGISPKIASYYGLLGESYESMKQNKEAVEIYKKGLLFENNGSLYYNIALVYEEKLNDKKNAISYYSQYLNSIKNPEKQKRHIAFIKNKIEELKR